MKPGRASHSDRISTSARIKRRTCNSLQDNLAYALSVIDADGHLLIDAERYLGELTLQMLERFKDGPMRRVAESHRLVVWTIALA